MIKKFVFRKCQRKINALNPKVNINLNNEMPTPSLKDISSFSPLVSKVNSYAAELEKKPDMFLKI